MVIRSEMARVAEVIVETLIAANVRRIYGVVGDSLNALTEALRRSETIEWIGVRHEEVAAFAAGADAHLTGALAVCAGSCGPGNMHLINGLYDCHRSRVPVLAHRGADSERRARHRLLPGDPPRHPVSRTAAISASRSRSRRRSARLLPIAIRTALGRRGVSVLTISGDVALREVATTGRGLRDRFAVRDHRARRRAASGRR